MPATMLMAITAPHNQATGRHLLEREPPIREQQDQEGT
jgi:hypothetical protein